MGKVMPEVKVKIKQAVEWLNCLPKNGHPPEKPVTAAQIFGIPQYTDAIRVASKRAQHKERNSKGLYNKYSGNNKILSEEDESAIIKYCADQADPGQFGATKPMIRSAIIFILSRRVPPHLPPSEDWFTRWFKAKFDEKKLHMIKTKPIARERLETHTDEDIKRWFNKYCTALNIHGIKKAKRVWNMDESGVRIGVPSSEQIVIPYHITELYTGGPENRKSLTVIETVNAAGIHLPAFVISPGKEIMESWINAMI
jgi:hypothetical protein